MGNVKTSRTSGLFTACLLSRRKQFDSTQSIRVSSSSLNGVCIDSCLFGHNSGTGLRRSTTLATRFFHCVDHDTLLARLRQSYGFDSLLYDWLFSYLRERSQHVRSCGKSAAPETIKYDVPQGSVLGPLMFVLYTADIGRIIDSHRLSSHFYVDDAQTYIFGKPDNVDVLREATVGCLCEVAMWMHSNRFRLNQSNTEFVWCTTRWRLQPLDNSQTQLGTKVVPSTTVRNLGVFIDQSLTITSHISIVTGRCFRSLRQIRTIRRSLALDAARTLLSSLVIPRIDYCNCILADLPAHGIARLESVLNAGARVIHQRRKSDHITDVLRDDLHWPPAAECIQFKLCLTVCKALHNVAPTYISNMCVATISAHSCRCLRSADDAKLDD